MLPKVKTITLMSEKTKQETTLVWKKLSKVEKGLLKKSLIKKLLADETVKVKLDHKQCSLSLTSKGTLLVTEIL